MKKNGTGLADSPFFTPPAQEVFTQPHQLTPTVRTENRTEFRSEMRTTSLPQKRRTKRSSFEFYEDQLFRLRKLKYEADQAGQQLSLSDLVREALDQYLQDK